MASKLPETIGQYKVVRELGRGTMGTVYLAVQESLGRDLAIKLMASEFTRDEEFVERFRREGKIAARLRHPNIVQVYDFSDRDGQYYIVMEYLGSRNLKQFIEESGGKIPLSQALKLTDQILSGLELAHSLGIVHRDVKPANIMVSERNEATLTDFSIAHMAAANRLTQTGAAVGTPEYMAPEQFDAKNVDGRADLYAVGLILYEMLAGFHPMHGESIAEVMKAQFFKDPELLHELDPSIPKTLSLAIARSLRKSADERYPTAAEMRAAFQGVGTPEAAPTGSSLEQFLADVASGKISLDDANQAREKVKAAIDQGFRKNLTFMMVDLAGSSKIKIPHQTLHADRAFRDYRATINAVLQEFQCMSYEWAGDGAICIFSQPLEAVQAAVKIQSLVDTVGDRHPDLPDKLRARIGINTGEVYLDPRRGLGEFASRTVDQAGHLEKDCPVGSVHVSQATMEQTRQAFEFAEVGVNRDQVKVFSVLRPRGETPAVQESRSGKPKVSLIDSGKMPPPASAPPAARPAAAAPAPAEEKFCPNCGQPSLTGARFCPHCGFERGSLTRIPSPTQPAEAPPPRPEPAPPAAWDPQPVKAPSPPPPPPPPPAPKAEPARPPAPPQAKKGELGPGPKAQPIGNRPLAPPPEALTPSGDAENSLGAQVLNQGPMVVAICALCCFVAAVPGALTHNFQTHKFKAILLLGGEFGLVCLTFLSLVLCGYLLLSGQGLRRSLAQLFMTGGIFVSLLVLLQMSR